jgi:hypothetical protein
MLQILKKTEDYLLAKSKLISPYKKHFKLDLVQGNNKQQSERYNYTLNFGARKLTQQYANFKGFNICWN